jgi:hypothetical protein
MPSLISGWQSDHGFSDTTTAATATVGQFTVSHLAVAADAAGLCVFNPPQGVKVAIVSVGWAALRGSEQDCAVGCRPQVFVRLSGGKILVSRRDTKTAVNHQLVLLAYQLCVMPAIRALSQPRQFIPNHTESSGADLVIFLIAGTGSWPARFHSSPTNA